MRNYLSRTVLLTVLVVVMLVALSMFGPTNLGFLEFRRANILSHVVSDSLIASWLGQSEDDSLFMEQVIANDLVVDPMVADCGAVCDSLTGDSLVGGASGIMGQRIAAEYKLKAGADSLAEVIFADAQRKSSPESAAYGGVTVTPIEDYTVLGRDELSKFFDKLSSCRTWDRPLRIAFLGDSFIESDIMTSDLRRQLQGRFGGSGPGFVQISSQQAPFSRSVGHKWNGWRRVSAIDGGGKGEEYLPSLLAYYPSENCYVEWTLSPKSAAHNKFHNIKIIYTNRATTTVVASVNGTERIDFVLSAAGDSLQVMDIEVPDSMDVRSFRLAFSNVSGLKLYGAMFDDEAGVTIDNYSLRGNSGLTLSNISTRLSRQLQQVYPTDLIVMSYGLNVVSANNTNYKSYIEQMRKRIAHLRAAMPGVPILMLSVSDRSSRNSTGGFVTMRGVVALEQAQRELAKSTAVAFWSTYRAMRAMGGMEHFVKNGWAAKDYTHIGSAGGRKVASALFDALIAQQQQLQQQRSQRRSPLGTVVACGGAEK